MDLIQAAKENDLENVAKLLSQQCNINATGQYGYTALMIASMKGLYKMTHVLLSHSANVLLKSGYGFSALVFACLNRKKDIVSLLLIYEADEEEITNNYNSIAYHYGCTLSYYALRNEWNWKEMKHEAFVNSPFLHGQVFLCSLFGEEDNNNNNNNSINNNNITINNNFNNNNNNYNSNNNNNNNNNYNYNNGNDSMMGYFQQLKVNVKNAELFLIFDVMPLLFEKN